MIGRRICILTLLMLLLCYLQIQCSLNGGDKDTRTTTVEIQRTVNVQTEETTVSTSEGVDLESEMDDADVDKDGYSVQSSQIIDIQLILHDLTTGGDATFREFKVSFRRVTPPVYKTLFQWISDNEDTILSVLNVPMTEWNGLTINEDGKRTFENYFTAEPAPEIIMISELLGISEGPIQLNATMTIKMQLTLVQK